MSSPIISTATPLLPPTSPPQVATPMPQDTLDPLAVDAAHGSGAYGTRGLALVRGEGTFLYDVHGRAYLDCMAGHGAASLGHGHPRLLNALKQQAAALVTCPGSLANPTRARFLDALHQTLEGYERFFLCNSGTEAIEAALKYARWHTGRRRVLAARRAFHGRTQGAMAATWSPRRPPGLAGLTQHVDHVPFGDLDAVAQLLADDVAAVLVEPIQGEGGVHPAEAGYLEGLQRLCRMHGALLVVDEVQTGIGRTGRWLASEHWGIRADLVALAKGLGAGVPLGALALADGLPPFPVGLHGSTFGGNPLACAAGLATLQTIEDEDLLRHSARLGQWALTHLEQRLASSQRVRAVRGRGLMIGIELRERVTPLLRHLMEGDGILALPAGRTVLRLLPPLVIDEDTWRWAVQRIVERLHPRPLNTEEVP